MHFIGGDNFNIRKLSPYITCATKTLPWSNNFRLFRDKSIRDRATMQHVHMEADVSIDGSFIALVHLFSPLIAKCSEVKKFGRKIYEIFLNSDR